MAMYEKNSSSSAPRRRRRGHPVLITLLALLVIAALVVGYAFTEVKGTFRDDTPVMVEIPQGASTTMVAAKLEQSGAIGNTLLFRLYSRLTKADGSYQYGSFEVSPGWDYARMIQELQKVIERQNTVTVTFPEGYNAYQFGEKLEEAGLCTKTDFIDALNTHTFDVSFLTQIKDDPNKMVKLDGFLFPDTYQFFEGEDVDSIILRMLKNFENKVLTQERKAQIEASGYSLEDLIIFSSIIQKEAANVEEMYNVSSVFTNRMKAGSPYPQLESCTTNNYINDYIKPQYQGNNLDEVLSAYDTYGMVGFPVGAIANPGLDAIDAALNPNDTDYYFFVTDIEFTHYYGRTWQEHLNNIEKAKAVNLTYGKVGL